MPDRASPMRYTILVAGTIYNFQKNLGPNRREGRPPRFCRSREALESLQGVKYGFGRKSFVSFRRLSISVALLLSTVAQAQNQRKPSVPPDLVNVSYGPHERNVLDLWKASPTADR